MIKSFDMRSTMNMLNESVVVEDDATDNAEDYQYIHFESTNGPDIYCKVSGPDVLYDMVELLEDMMDNVNYSEMIKTDPKAQELRGYPIIDNEAVENMKKLRTDLNDYSEFNNYLHEYTLGWDENSKNQK